MTPPIIAATARRPTTTPTATPTLLVPPLEDFGSLSAVLDAVTTIVCPALVMTDAIWVVELLSELVVVEVEVEVVCTLEELLLLDSLAVGTMPALSNPVR